VFLLVLTDDELEKLIKAGEIVRRVLDYASSYVKPGLNVLDVCERLENMIIDLGGLPAFPCNVSINSIAAHYTSPPNDSAIIPQNSLVKVDVGAHVDGYIADAAITLSFNPDYDVMVDAVKAALNRAISMIRPGIKVSQISRSIEEVIRGYGFKPISNLCGHLLRRYILHGGKSIPNISGNYPWIVEEGDVFAIEPFATDGGGRVVEGSSTYIFSFVRNRAKGRFERKLLSFIRSHFRSLPFCTRWFKGFFNIDSVVDVLDRLNKNGSIYGYPVLKEVKGGLVAQAEHSVIVTGDGALVTTLGGRLN